MVKELTQTTYLKEGWGWYDGTNGVVKKGKSKKNTKQN